MIRKSLVALSVVVSFFPGSGCSRPPPPDWPTSPPSALCDDPTLGPEAVCMPAARIERILRDGDLRVTHSALSETGVTAPTKLRIEASTKSGVISFAAKFKPIPVPDGDAFNNSPRREVAAYELQKLFLDEEDWVVPPTVLRCLDLDRYGKWLSDTKPWPGTNCALGIMAYWLDNVSDDDVLDAELFKRDATYRYHLSNANVLTALIGHEDSLGKNMMISTDPKRPRVFAIDNGLAFEAMEFNPIVLLSGAWGEMRVPVVPEKTAARLMKLDGSDLEGLRVVAQMALRDGRLVHVPETDPLANDEGFRAEGNVLQWGLTVEEVSNVHERLVGLLGEIQKDELVKIPDPSPDGRPVETTPDEDGAPDPGPNEAAGKNPRAVSDAEPDAVSDPKPDARQPVSGEGEPPTKP